MEVKVSNNKKSSKVKKEKVKVNLSSNDAGVAVCPVCGAELVHIDSLTVDGNMISLYKDIGGIYQCSNPACNLYFLKTNGKFEAISKLDIIKKQMEITDFIASERKSVVRKVYATAAFAADRAELGRALSRILWVLTTENIFHRAYTIEELYEACNALGLNPVTVDNDTVPAVFTWLKEHKGK